MSEKLIIRDEVHGIIELEGVYAEIVKTKEFERLKDIIQTGTTYFKYPEMKEENRFQHSVGSYYLMCKIINNIEEKLAMHGLKISDEKKEIAKISMLLHDIGHGAFSHTLEKITGYSHEKRGIDIVKDKDTEIYKVIEKYYGEDFTNKVSEFLEKVYEHKKQDKPLEDIKVENETINLEELLASLISNNIDADRLDYIVRDSKKAGFNILTEVDKLIESFEFVLDIDKIIVAIPEEKKILSDMAILERARNYRDIYYCTPSVIGDHIFNFLLEKLRENPHQIPDSIKPVICKFLINSKAEFTNKEYMEITEKPIQEALQEIRNYTEDEQTKKLCDVKKITDSYQELNTDKSEKYIRYLLHKAIPELDINTKGLIEQTRWVKPYKSNESESINIITRNGIEDYKDVKQELISLEPFPKRTIAISHEMLRLELGISKEEYDSKYKEIIEEVISTVTKAKDEFELRYVLTKSSVDGQEVIDKIKEKYEVIDSAEYMSRDIYYDNPENYELLENKEALRIRRGTSFHKSKQTYKFKSTRATYKTYKKDIKSNFTVRKKEEEIGDTDRIGDYDEFLKSIGINKEKMEPVLDVDNIRRLYTVKINGVLIDISFNTAWYKNEIYEMFGNVGTIEIKPRENKITNRLSLLQFRQFLEKEFPELTKYLSNTNVYEIGMLDTYEKYRKGYIISEDAQEYEEKYPKATEKLSQISERARKKEDFEWLNQILPAEVIIQENKNDWKEEK